MTILLPYSTINLKDYDLNVVGVKRCGAIPRWLHSHKDVADTIRCLADSDMGLEVGQFLDFEENGIRWAFFVSAPSRYREVTKEAVEQLIIHIGHFGYKTISISDLFTNSKVNNEFASEMISLIRNRLGNNTRIDFYGSK